MAQPTSNQSDRDLFVMVDGTYFQIVVNDQIDSLDSLRDVIRAAMGSKSVLTLRVRMQPPDSGTGAGPADFSVFGDLIIAGEQLGAIAITNLYQGQGGQPGVH